MLCFFQAEDGIRDLVRSRGLGDVYKRQELDGVMGPTPRPISTMAISSSAGDPLAAKSMASACLLYTSDAADERSSVDLGGRRIIKKKNN